ncbi:hypothetical protein BBJ28_00012143 [Nothophytophthora sp. Chile5]|nr:hypothetical protein BBJ28_00012143 [Nothophytophthora sp. Chile5]
MAESYYLGSSCRGSLRSCDFESSKAASPVSARNALLSKSSINAVVSDGDLFATAASVVPKLRAVVAHRKSAGWTSVSSWQTPVTPTAVWIAKKKHHGVEICEFDRAKLPPSRSDKSRWMRGPTARAVDTRRSMIEPRESLQSRDGFVGDHQTYSEVQTRPQLQWPLNDRSVAYAVSAHVTLSCRLDEAMAMLFSREVLQFNASMSALFGAKKFKRGDLLVSRAFRKDLRTMLASDSNEDDDASCWDDEDLSDLSQPGWVALQSVVLRSRRSLNPMAATKHGSRRQHLWFAGYSQCCPAANEAFYAMKTLSKAMHDQFRSRTDAHAAHQALRGDVDRIAAGYHLTGSYSDLSGHQTRVVMTAYVTTPPVHELPDALKPRSRFWSLGVQPNAASASSSLASRRRYPTATVNAEAKYVVNLLAAATTSFEELVRRRRLGYQPFQHVPMNRDAAQQGSCKVCHKSFGLLRVERFCQLCGHLVCRDCSRKFDVEPVARSVRRSRICYACVANVDASVFQQENPLLNTPFPSEAASTVEPQPAKEEEEGETAGLKISTAFYDILLKEDIDASETREKPREYEEVSPLLSHRLDRSSSAATTMTSVSSTPGRQLADALFSGDPLLRARALEVVRRVVQQVTQQQQVSHPATASSSAFNASIPVFQPQFPDRKMVDKYLEARLHLSSISSTPDDPGVSSSDAVRERSSSLLNAQDATQCRRRSTSGQCFSSTAGVGGSSDSFSATPRRHETPSAALATELLDLDDDVDSAALDSICEVAASRMRCSMAFVVALNGAQPQRIVGSCGAPRPWSDMTVCPFPLAAGGKPFVVKDPMRDPRLRRLRVVRDVGVRFYAGFPIKTPDGSVAACLCTADTRARDSISLEDLAAMHALSKLASDLFEEEVNPYTPRSRA